MRIPVSRESFNFKLEESLCRKALSKWGFIWNSKVSSISDHVRSHGKGKLLLCLFQCRREEHFLVLDVPDGELRLEYTGDPELVDADSVFLYVGTAGEALSSYASSGELERVAVVVTALGEIQEKLFSLVERWSESHGAGVGSLMSPGSADGFAIEESIKIASLLNSSDIGVAVSLEGYLSPDYAIIGMIPVGKKFKDVKVTFLCDRCRHWSTCPLKRTRDERCKM